MARHPLQHEEVEAHRRGDLRHLDDDDDEDAEPDQVDPGRADHRLDDRHRQHHRRDPVKEHADDDVEDGECRDQRHRREVHRRDPARQRAWHAGEAHRQGEEACAHQDQRNHRRGAHRAKQAVAERAPAHRALQAGKRQRADNAEGRGLGRGGKPHIHRADHQHDQRDHRQQQHRVAQLGGKAHPRLGRGHLVAAQDRPERDIAHEQPGQHEPRQHARHEQAGDAFAHADAIDDQRHRGRDHQAKRRGAGKGADDHELGVAALPQLGDRHLADRGQRRRRRARDCREDGAAHDVRVQEPARKAREPGREPLEHVLGQFRAIQDLAHPDEQRQRGQRPARGAGPDGDRHRAAGIARGEAEHADIGHPHQRQPDPEPGAEQEEHHEEEDADLQPGRVAVKAGHRVQRAPDDEQAQPEQDDPCQPAGEHVAPRRDQRAVGAIAVGEQHPHEVVDQREREDHRAHGHGDLRDPQRRAVLALRDIVELRAQERRAHRIPGEEHADPRAERIAPDLDAAAPAPGAVDEQADTDVLVAGESIGEPEEGGGGHRIAGVIRPARQQQAEPARDHLRDDEEQDRDQGDCRPGA
ncbi:hypothetical protein SDC9_20586 [bioreactor metagenome]|uniref:Uncharacterized protein n=1 Tax=bioreactor metagenome TaxID=1076179 RepID=A0A644U759_9ZZZZ